MDKVNTSGGPDTFNGHLKNNKKKLAFFQVKCPLKGPFDVSTRVAGPALPVWTRLDLSQLNTSFYVVYAMSSPSFRKHDIVFFKFAAQWRPPCRCALQ